MMTLSARLNLQENYRCCMVSRYTSNGIVLFLALKFGTICAKKEKSISACMMISDSFTIPTSPLKPLNLKRKMSLS